MANFGFVIFSNLITLLISSVVILVLPKVIGIEEYGYWQLYTFYLTYIGVFHFGWCDGIYLKFGGNDYKKLDKDYFFSQLWLLMMMQIVLSLSTFLVTTFFAPNPDIQFIFYSLSVNFIFTNVRLFFIYTLQTTNEIRTSSLITIFDRTLYIVFIIVILLAGLVDYRWMILSDNIARFLSLCYGFYVCRDIAFRNFSKLKIVFSDVLDNIFVGINLMLSNIASSLIIGVIRFAIQKNWNISTFGKVSLTLSVSNLMMVFINAVGVVIFPILKRTQEEKLPTIYSILRSVLMLVMLSVLVAYYPLRIFLEYWLPHYRESLVYMGIVFPMALFEGKMSLLINTYLKAFRKERLIFYINASILCLSIVMTGVMVFVLDNLVAIVLTIPFLLATRSIVSEFFLSRILHVSVWKDICYEVTLSLIFILANFFLPIGLAFITYFTSFAIYCFVQRQLLSQNIRRFRSFVK